MKYTKSMGTSGAWVKASEVTSGIKAKLVTETLPSESVWEGKTIKNNVAKIRFQGDEGEAKNVNVNKPSINGLIDAFGEEAKSKHSQRLTRMDNLLPQIKKKVVDLDMEVESFQQ
jgi:hypothetical protein